MSLVGDGARVGGLGVREGVCAKGDTSGIQVAGGKSGAYGCRLQNRSQTEESEGKVEESRAPLLDKDVGSSPLPFFLPQSFSC